MNYKLTEKNGRMTSYQPHVDRGRGRYPIDVPSLSWPGCEKLTLTCLPLRQTSLSNEEQRNDF